MMAALGQFVFGLPTLAYQQLQRSTTWKHRGSSRVGVRDSSQFLGAGDDCVVLTGLLAPELTGTYASLDALREMADAGDAYVLVDGAGHVYGAFVIEQLDETQSIQDAQGVARRIEFTINLKRVDDELVRTVSAANQNTEKPAP